MPTFKKIALGNDDIILDIKMEVPTGIEPVYAVLQTAA